MRNRIVLLLISAGMFALPQIAAANIVYHVSLDTTFLGANPFTLDFQFLNGDPAEILPNNLATVTNGNAFPSFTLKDGNVPSGTAGIGEQAQAFMAGGILLFDLSLTENVDDGPTPDFLALSIFDSMGNYVSTTDPGGFDTIVSFVESADPLHPGISALTFDTPTGQLNATVTIIGENVPEPATVLLGGLCLIAIMWGRRRDLNVTKAATEGQYFR